MSAVLLAACEASMGGSGVRRGVDPSVGDASPDVEDAVADAQPLLFDDAGPPEPRSGPDAGPSPGSDAGPGGSPPSCGSATECGACGATAGCAWCAGTGACTHATDAACSYGLASGAAACPGPVEPCLAASCWDPSTTLSRCRSSSLDEDFSSGRYAVHRYGLRIEPGGPVDIRYERRAGSFQPALFVTDATGRLVHAGATVDLHPSLSVLASADGRSGSAATLTVEARATIDLRVHVTTWEVVSSDFRATVPTSSQYRVAFAQRCPPGMSSGVHDGIDQDGSHIPRAGLANGTLEGALGVSVEPYGDVVTDGGASWVRGTVSWFGGPADTGVSSTETGAITGERLRSLNDPLGASPSVIASRPEDFYFVAMRFDYSPGGRAFWRDARLLIKDPASGREVVVRPVDWGPNTSTRRIVDLSPQSLEDLGLSTDDVALVAFAAPGTPLGPVP